MNPVDELLMGEDESNLGFSPPSASPHVHQPTNSNQPPPAPRHLDTEKKEEVAYLSELSRVCKEKKLVIPNFDQKRFMKESLYNKFGEERATSILNSVFTKLKEQQKQKMKQQHQQQQLQRQQQQQLQQPPQNQPSHQHQQQHQQQQQQQHNSLPSTLSLGQFNQPPHNMNTTRSGVPVPQGCPPQHSGPTGAPSQQHQQHTGIPPQQHQQQQQAFLQYPSQLPPAAGGAVANFNHPSVPPPATSSTLGTLPLSSPGTVPPMGSDVTSPEAGTETVTAPATTATGKKKAAPRKKKDGPATGGGKRKAKEVDPTAGPGPGSAEKADAGATGQQKQPPLKKARKTPGPKKETAKSKKMAAAAAKLAAEQSGGVDGASTDGNRASVDTESKKDILDEHGLERVDVDDFVPKEVSGVSSFVSEKVVSEESCAVEAKKTPESMRRAFKEGDPTMPSVLSRTKEGDGGEFSMFSFGAPEGGGAAAGTGSSDKESVGLSVMDKLLLHESKAQALCKEVLSPRGMNYTKEAMSALADGMQSHFRSLIESAIASYHKRTNRKAMEHYKQMDTALSSTLTIPNANSADGTSGSTVCLSPGTIKPDNTSFYALLFGPDVAAAVAAEKVAKTEKIRVTSAAVLEQLREVLEQTDEALKKGQKKTMKGVEKRTDSVGAVGGGNVKNATDDNVAWWKKEDVMEKEGALNWEQLALSRLKLKVAAKHDLGPKARKKPRKEKAGEEHKTDLSHSQPMDIEESVESAVGSVEEKSVPASGERPVASDNKDSMNPFPDIDNSPTSKDEDPDAVPDQTGPKTVYRLTRSDACAALTKHAAPRHLHGEGHCAAYGSVLKIAKSIIQ